MLRNIFITGGTGFIGRTILSRSEAEWHGSAFTVYSRDEMKLQRVAKHYPETRTIMGDILDPEHMYLSMVGHDVVIHAAAQKHIPRGEKQPKECFITNVIGTINVIQAALKAGIQQVVIISTDKVADPMNAYGMSKAAMERISCQLSMDISDMTINVVRYGNVVGSTGSVIPKFQEQAAAGMPLSVTNPSMTRFWLAPSEASQLLCTLANSMLPAGTVYIPKLPAMTLHHLVAAIAPNSEITITGLRPGEKMHECLMTAEERTRAIESPGHYLLYPSTTKMRDINTPGAYMSNTPVSWVQPVTMREWIAEAESIL